VTHIVFAGVLLLDYVNL